MIQNCDSELLDLEPFHSEPFGLEPSDCLLIRAFSISQTHPDTCPKTTSHIVIFGPLVD